MSSGFRCSIGAWYILRSPYGLVRLLTGSQSTTFASLASMVTFTPAFRAPETQHLRAGMFGSLAPSGLSTLICVSHSIALHGWHEHESRFPMWSIGLTLFFNATGANIYALQFPEHWWRRRFVIFGASHQIMHTSILIASLIWLGGMLEAFEYSHSRVVLGRQSQSGH